MNKVIVNLDCNIAMPNISDKINKIITQEIENDIQEMQDQIIIKIEKLLEKHTKLKIYQESA